MNEAEVGGQNAVGESDIAAQSDPVWEKAKLERVLFDQLLGAWMRLAQPV